jgi:hypothetical protein
LGIKQDTASFDKADQSISKLKTGLKALGAILVTGVVARGLESLTEDASDAAETTNVLTKVFQENAGAVEDWAGVMATEMGRSRYELREMAGNLGKVIQPMIGSREAAASMSTRLAQAAVDLASLNNETDPRALAAIRSGMIGMARPLYDFGVNLSIATLETFAMSRGIKKSFQQMTTAEKMTLRYEAIIAQSANAHGDAADTSEQYANATKGLHSALRDLGTMIGQALLPGAERFVTFARDAVRGLEELLRGTRFLEVALAGLGVIATIVGIQMLLPFLPAIAVALGLAAAFALVSAVIEDIWVFFTGGESLIGRVLEGWGVDVDALRESFDKLWVVAKRVFSAIAEKAGEIAAKFKPYFVKAFDAVGEALGQFIAWASTKFMEFADAIGPLIDSLFEFDVEKATGEVGDFFSEFGKKVQAFLASPVGKVLVALLGAYLGKKAGAFAGENLGEALGKLLGKTKIAGSEAAGGFIGKHAGRLLGTLTGAVAGGAGALAFAEGVQPRPEATAAGVGTMTSSHQVTVNQTIQGTSDPATTAKMATEGVREVLREDYKTAKQALTPAMAR